jgi:hypothetical protein
MNLIGQFFTGLFSLPAGSIYSNLIASALLGVGGFVYGRAFERRAIQRHKDQILHRSALHAELVDHIGKIHQKLDIK